MSTINKLFAAARYGRYNDVRKWVRKWFYKNVMTVNVNETDDKRSWTALHFASHSGHYDIVHYLLMHGADIIAVTNRDETPLMIACAEGHVSITALLLLWECDDKKKKLALVNAVNDRGETALHCACMNGHVELVNDLINNEADKTIRNNEGNAPIKCLTRYLEKKYQPAFDILNFDMKKKADDPTEVLTKKIEIINVKNAELSECISDLSSMVRANEEKKRTRQTRQEEVKTRKKKRKGGDGAGIWWDEDTEEE